LESGATYSHQLNVVLPAFVSILKMPCLPDNIRGSLNRLRKLRNDMAHRGGLDIPIEKETAAEYLCAALFGFHYLKLIGRLFKEYP